MELKEYLKIIKEHGKVFWAMVIVAVVGSFAYFYVQPISYNVSLALNITRSGTQETSDYKFDDFYRLQADEKFAETLVEWLKNPRVVLDVYNNSKIDASNASIRSLSRIFKAEKFSSQLVTVSFSAKNMELGKKMSASIVEIVDKNIENLNQEQKESGWFSVVAGEPVIIKNYVSPVLILLFSLLGGMFLAFWIVLIIHYLK